MKHFFREHIKANKKKYLILCFFGILGLFLGFIIAYLLSSTIKGNLISYVENFFTNQNTTTIAPYKKSALTQNIEFDGIFFLSIFIFSYARFGAFALCTLLIVRGFISGFAVGFFVSQYAFNGFLFSLFTLLPQNLIKLFLLTFFSVIAVSASLGEKVNKRRNYSILFLICVAVFFVNIAVILFEIYILPYIMFVFAGELM